MLPFLDETDELFNYWILRALLLVVLYLAWRSTYVREDRPSAQDAVLAIENNLRRLNTLPLRRLNTQHNVTTIILRSSSQQSNISNVTETEGLDLENDSIASSIDNITQSILTEASESATGLDLSDTEGYPSVVRPAVVVDTFHDAGPEEIIRQMDATDQDGGSRPSTITDNTAGTPSSSELRQRRRPPTAGNEPNAAALPERAGTASALETVTADSATGSDVKPIRIKLKYLNDDSKLVEGNLNEGIGEFKRRNFTLELAAQKLVRLVFNGHVLQPDTKTLAACGLFDNCVVHCLIHNQKSSLNGGDRAQDGGTVSGDNRFQIAAGDSANDGDNSENGNENADNREANGHPNESTRSRTRYGTYFIHIGTLAVTVLILYGWYCRFHYGHLFNMSSTIGLIATTTTFLIMMPTIILADSNTPN